MKLGFDDKDNVVYVIDTSGLIMLESTFKYDTVFFNAKKLAEGQEEADPYLIAYCKVNSFVLITNENKNKPNKIPGVSAKHGVRCIDIYDFFVERELKMERKKR